VFRVHGIGIATDYNNNNFRDSCHFKFKPADWIPEPVSMLAITKDWVALQECVGDNAR
jgi:hypothetical protein